LAQISGELEPDHLWDQHRYRLAKHRGLGFNTAYAPAEHAEPVDHRRVRVGAHQRVGISLRWLAAFRRCNEYHARKVFQIDLVNDAHVGRDNRQIAECTLSPAQELIALAVAHEL